MSRPRNTTSQAALPRICTGESIQPGVSSSMEPQNACTSSLAPALQGKKSARSAARAQSDLTETKRVFASKFQSRGYKRDKVHVLLLSWAEGIDDLKVEPEVRELQDVFSEDYGFNTAKHRMKDRKEANLHLAKFANDFDQENTLLIVYYAGHGDYDANQDELNLYGAASDSTISASERNRKSIAWQKAEGNLQAVDHADVLVIFDCCFAGSLGQTRATIPRTFEFMAACAAGEYASIPGPRSFTRALIESLKEFRQNPRPFSTLQLLDKIRERRTLKPDQNPQLIPRFGPYDDNVWIAPLNAEEEMEHTSRLQANHEYLDIRLHSTKPFEEADIELTASMLNHLVNNGLPDFKTFPIRNIEVMKRGSIIAEIAEKWIGFRRASTSQIPKIKAEAAPSSATSATPVATPASLKSSEFLSPSSAVTLENDLAFRDTSPSSVGSPVEIRTQRQPSGCPRPNDSRHLSYTDIRMTHLPPDLVEQMLRTGIKHHGSMLFGCVMDTVRNFFFRTTFRFGLVSEYLPSFKWSWSTMFHKRDTKTAAG